VKELRIGICFSGCRKIHRAQGSVNSISEDMTMFQGKTESNRGIIDLMVARGTRHNKKALAE
jgi:hypothetical protein